jgi:hypothetical protein
MADKEVDLRSLSMQQLEFLRKQTDDEVNSLTSNFTQLKAVQSKFSEAATALAAVTAADEGLCRRQTILDSAEQWQQNRLAAYVHVLT